MSQAVPLVWDEAGEGKAVILLHGFPDLGLGWRYQVEALAAAGFRAIAPDLRGYGRSPKPAGVDKYRMQCLIDDVVALIERSGESSVSLVGHDWGGVIAWFVAMKHPRLIEKLVILNAPHPRAYARELRRGSSQILRSWYAGVFQLPWLPETLLRFRRRLLLRRVWSHGPAKEEEILRRYDEAYADRHTLTCALNYYRAAARKRAPRTAIVQAPVLVLWGDRDRYLVRRLTDGLDTWVSKVRIRHFRTASHWLHHDESDEVNEALIDFLSE